MVLDSRFRIRDGRNYNRGFINALWQWRKVKTSTDTVGQSLEKEFLVDDTAITTTYISRKLDALEKFVRKGPTAQVVRFITVITTIKRPLLYGSVIGIP